MCAFENVVLVPVAEQAFITDGRGKGKVIPLHAMKALAVRGGTAPTHS
jgi:hypothetical protein